MKTKKLTPRRVYDSAPHRNYFGWDLRQTEREEVVWKREPRLSDMDLELWPYRFDRPADMVPDFSISVWGDPSDDLLTAWLDEEEGEEEMTCVAADPTNAV